MFIFNTSQGKSVLENCNQASEQLIVCETGQTAKEIFKSVPLIVSDIENCGSGGKTIQREHLFTQVNGMTKYFRFTFSRLPANLVVIHARDIDKFRLVESELRESKGK